jgi:hypothetical protein
VATYRVEHKFQGPNPESCGECGLHFKNHRIRVRPTDTRDRLGRIYAPRERKPVYVGIDGEGQGRNNHVYNMLCASDETGTRTWILESHDRERQLTTEEILIFLTSFPAYVKLFAYSFNYDITKILTDVDDRTLYRLFRPELRQRFGLDAYKGPRAEPWGRWRLNMQGTKFSVRHQSETRATIIWDVWKFYQSKFTSALTEWKVGTKREIDQMILMKDQREKFDGLAQEEVREYCLSECRLMAELARKLTEAHVTAGIPLKNYYGAGSSATSMLRKMNVRAHLKEAPEHMIRLVSQAFFGGRFDNSVVGTITGKIRGRDISSAYPYQAVQLPCLVHGRWEHTKRRAQLDQARMGVVRYSLKDSVSASTKLKPWGPFPFRMNDGSICYPAVSGGGWVWDKEFREGERLFENVKFEEAYVYHCECYCQPFKDLPGYYNERCRIGKEGPGIVLKLGANSVAGKTAQSVGSGPFRNWIWAGMINSGCRAQVLTALGLHKDWRNMLMVATDGFLSLEDIDLPPPADTGTDLLFKNDKGDMVRKPLGGWEAKDSNRGVFIARPGVYFPLNPTDEDIKVVRGRGVGRGVILQNWRKIIERFDAWDRVITLGDRDGFDEKGWPLVRVTNVSRFCGAKSSISRATGADGKYVYHRAEGRHMFGQKGYPVGKPEPNYGQWMTREVTMSFNPDPKRDNTQLGEDGRMLLLRRLPTDIQSAPYNKANISEEARQLLLMALEMNEQPDKDVADYEIDG